MAFVYLPDGQYALLFGGDGRNGQLADTWIWKAGCWSLQSPAQSPSARDLSAVVYDSVHREVLLYGGRGGGQFYSDTWTWTGQTWTQLASSGPPFMFGGPVVGFDPVTQRPLLFGMVSGGLPETWSWDGSNWQKLSPTRSPVGREAPSIALDPSRGQLMLFGGININLNLGALNDTWVWDGSNWNQLTPVTSPERRFRATMGSLAARKIVILWGGVVGGGIDDAWKWDGTNWSQIRSPGPRADAAAIDIGPCVVFFGGDGPAGYFSDLMGFDGTNWMSRS